VIRFEEFGKTFGDHVAVEGLSLLVGPGEVVALLGPNGSGKTTSLKAAAGLLFPTSGRVLVGAPEREAKGAEARRVLSFLPQRVAFPEALSGLEVVEFYRRLRGLAPERTAAVLKLASLTSASHRAVGTYSGGMLQRLGLAVAALPDVPVLLLDEPTAALDPEGLEVFYGLVEERRREGKTVLFTTHHLADVGPLADRVAVLVGGKLAAVRTADEISAVDRSSRPRLDFVYRELVGRKAS
jgi:Cu-processing system ATP-binding protein